MTMLYIIIAIVVVGILARLRLSFLDCVIPARNRMMKLILLWPVWLRQLSAVKLFLSNKWNCNSLLSERVLLPIIEKIGEISTRFTPQKLLQETTLKLELAGNPGRIDAATFLATRFVGAAVFGGGLLLISLLSAT